MGPRVQDNCRAVESIQDTSRILAVGSFKPDYQVLVQVVEYHGFMRIDLPNGKLVIAGPQRSSCQKWNLCSLATVRGYRAGSLLVVDAGKWQKRRVFPDEACKLFIPALCRNDMVIPQIGQS